MVQFDDPVQMTTALEDAFRDLERLGYEPSWERGYIRARCLHPDHLDSDPSMTVDVGSNNRLIVHCHSRDCDGGEMLEALNHEVEAPPPDEASRRYRSSRGKEQNLGKIVRVHDEWIDPRDGSEFRHYKYENGWIWRHRAGDVWMPGLGRKLEQMPLFDEVFLRMRLSSRPDDPVYWCEGEKDALAATGLKAIATCDAGVPPADLNLLKDRAVIIVPDRDEGGARRAAKVQTALTGVASTVRILYPKPDHPKADLSDHVAAGFGLDDLVDESKNADRLKLIEDMLLERIDLDAGEAQIAVKRYLTRSILDEVLEIIEAEERWESLALPEPKPAIDQEGDDTPNWAVEDLIHRDGGTMLVAQAKAGKTTAALHLCKSLLSGSPFLGHWESHALEPEQNVLWLDTEMGPLLSGWARKVLGPDAARLITWHLRGKTGSMDIRQESIREGIVAKLKGINLGYVVVDVLGAWATSLGIDENSNSEMRGLVEAIISLAARLGSPGVLVTHHMGHQQGRARGASALLDWTHSSLYLVRGEETLDNGERFASPSDQEVRWLWAEGREVSLPKTPLRFDIDNWNVQVASPDEVPAPTNTSKRRAALRLEGQLIDVLRLLSVRQMRINELRRAAGLSGRYRAVLDAGIERGFFLETEDDEGKILSMTEMGRAWYGERVAATDSGLQPSPQ